MLASSSRSISSSWQKLDAANRIDEPRAAMNGSHIDATGLGKLRYVADPRAATSAPPPRSARLGLNLPSRTDRLDGSKIVLGAFDQRLQKERLAASNSVNVLRGSTSIYKENSP